MSFFKKILQTVLKEEDGNKDLITNNSSIQVNKTVTSKVIDKLEKGNNGIFGDEYEQEEKLIQSLNDRLDLFLLEEEEDDDDDSANYRDKDLEAKKAYIEKMKKKALLRAEKIKNSKKSGTKGDSGKKSGSGKKENDWGKRTSERNLNREVGGMERDYEKELRDELKLRSDKRKHFRKTMEALRIVIRRRLKRMHINRAFLMRYHRNIINFKKIKKGLKKIGAIISTKNINKIRKIKLEKVKQKVHRLNKAKKVAKKRKISYLRSNEEMKKKYLEEYKKAQKIVTKQQKSSKNIGISI